jgi:predicted Na+-dependent transporter
LTPEERLCQRVMQLSCSTGVSPAVSAALGQAVARYYSEHTRKHGRWWSAIATLSCLTAVFWFAVAGLKNLYRMELERSTEPLWAAAWGVLGVAQLAAGVWFATLARRMFSHWRHFRASP